MSGMRARAIRDGLSVAGIVMTAFLLIVANQKGDFGFDARAYWAVDFSDLYRGTETTQGLGSFRYAPVIAQVFAPFAALDWYQFLWLWEALLVGTLIWLGGRWTVALLAFIAVPAELIHGNIHLLMAAAIVLGFRHPWTWAFILLTKATPGIGLLWFAVRREWRQLGIALGATAGLVAISFVAAPNLWSEWLETLLNTRHSLAANEIAVPLILRLPLAALVVSWGGLTNRPWTVPVAVTLALPTIWIHGLAVLVAAFTIEHAQAEGRHVVRDEDSTTSVRGPSVPLPARTTRRRLTPR